MSLPALASSSVGVADGDAMAADQQGGSNRVDSDS
jgi:hypothetical protein